MDDRGGGLEGTARDRTDKKAWLSWLKTNASIGDEKTEDGLLYFLQPNYKST